MHLTVTLRPKFREISQLLQKMDRLVLRFRKTEPGTAFANVWAASRIVRDLGGSAPEKAHVGTGLPVEAFLTFIASATKVRRLEGGKKGWST
jgi:hypothetical protein